jgi:hypothetical protein
MKLSRRHKLCLIILLFLMSTTMAVAQKLSHFEQRISPSFDKRTCSFGGIEYPEGGHVTFSELRTPATVDLFAADHATLKISPLLGVVGFNEWR